MKIVKLIERADGSLAWATDNRTLGQIYTADGVWRTSWSGEAGPSEGYSWLGDDFPTPYDACLAAEKHWPSSWRPFHGWLESKKGGYFRKFGKRRTVYVRKAPQGWYAVQTDGKLLGKDRTVSWFTTALEACAAVEKELHTPVDADPFVNAPDRWRWIKLKNTDRAA